METHRHLRQATYKGKNKYHFRGQKILILVNFLKMNDFIMVNEGLTNRFWAIFWISMKRKYVDYTDILIFNIEEKKKNINFYLTE